MYYPHGQKVGDEGAVDRRADEPKTDDSGMPNAQQRGNKDIESPNEIGTPDFSSSFEVAGQVT